MNDTICKNYFKDGKTSTTVQAYTGAWVRDSSTNWNAPGQSCPA